MDYLIIAVIALLAVVGIIYTVRHFRHQSGCCGGGDYKPKRKKLAHIEKTKTFSVDGMSCEHCKNRVEEIINDMTDVAGRVDLKKGTLTVLYGKDARVSDELIRQRLERAGYTVTGIVKE